MSGIAAAMLSVNPFLRPREVLNIIQNTAKAFPEGSTCTTSTCGAGIIDAGAAVEQARNADLASTAGIRLINELVDFEVISEPETITPPCAIKFDFFGRPCPPFTPCVCVNPPGIVAEYKFVARLKLKSGVSQVLVVDPQIEVSRLTNGNLICPSEGTTINSIGGVGTILTPSDRFLGPAPFIDVNFDICLRNWDRFEFFVNVGGHDRSFIR